MHDGEITGPGVAETVAIDDERYSRGEVRVPDNELPPALAQLDHDLAACGGRVIDLVPQPRCPRVWSFPLRELEEARGPQPRDVAGSDAEELVERQRRAHRAEQEAGREDHESAVSSKASAWMSELSPPVGQRHDLFPDEQ